MLYYNGVKTVDVMIITQKRNDRQGQYDEPEFGELVTEVDIIHQQDKLFFILRYRCVFVR